jgi:hypothetical protein
MEFTGELASWHIDVGMAAMYKTRWDRIIIFEVTFPQNDFRHFNPPSKDHYPSFILPSAACTLITGTRTPRFTPILALCKKLVAMSTLH